MVNVHQDMAKRKSAHGKSLPRHIVKVKVHMYMVNVPHDMLKACADIVNVPQGMTKASIDMLPVSGYDKSINGHSKYSPGHGKGIHRHDTSLLGMLKIYV
jgi:hypothetical protein